MMGPISYGRSGEIRIQIPHPDVPFLPQGNARNSWDLRPVGSGWANEAEVMVCCLG